MGAEVYAFTHSDHKRADIKKMGADHIVLTSEKVRRRSEIRRSSERFPERSPY